jgi:hypothetical protein
MKSINEMIAAIEEKVCIRNIWRCNAGWGMRFALNREQRLSLLPSNFILKGDDPCTVFSYYNSLEECVKSEYAIWVEEKDRRAINDLKVLNQMVPVLEDMPNNLKDMFAKWNTFDGDLIEHYIAETHWVLSTISHRMENVILPEDLSLRIKNGMEQLKPFNDELQDKLDVNLSDYLE